MRGQMMDAALLVSGIARHADRNYPDREIVAVTADDPLHRSSYREVIARSRRLANALDALGLKQGDRVATLAWNDHRHLEAYYGIGGAGYVCHTLNPRLFPEQLVYIINHADDQWILTDAMFVPLLEKLAPKIRGVSGYVIMTDAAHMPDTALPNVHCYEDLIASASDEYEWPELDENDAVGLCYTSGTTGDPKGVLYSHRSMVLHAYASVAPDVMSLSNRDCILPVVPLFHVNAWGIPYSAFIVGAKLVLPGPKMGDGATLYRLLDSEAVTLALGVPTVWAALLQYCAESGKTLDKLRDTLIGGAAVPESMIRAFQEKHGVVVRQGWGMTETSPLGVVNTLKAGMEGLEGDELIRQRAKAGRQVFGMEMRIVDADGSELPWDGEAFGALQVRGPWVCSGYFGRDDCPDSHSADGWFNTGDVAKIDPQGYLQITDRTKDVIKSGGEWISSIELENVAMSHPAISEAAVIAVPHEKWTERPLLVAIRGKDSEVSKEELLGWFEGKIAKWWLPDDVVFVDEIPHTATGKVRKTELREQFADYELPAARH